MTVHCGQGTWNGGQWLLLPHVRQVVVAAQKGWISLFIDIVQKRGFKNEFFPPFRTEEHCDLGWNKGHSCGVWQDKANSSFLSCCFISHAFCAILSLLMISMITLEGQGLLHIQQEGIHSCLLQRWCRNSVGGVIVEAPGLKGFLAFRTCCYLGGKWEALT